MGRGSLGSSVAHELLQRGAAPLLLLDVDGRPGDRLSTADERVSWISGGKSTDPTFRDRLREAAVRAAAVIACSDAPSSLSRLLQDVCGDRVPLIACELTETGARLQILAPRESGAGCATCDAAFRASRDVLEAAVYEYLDQPVYTTVPWRYRHSASDLAIAARFVTVAIGTAVSAASTGAVADSRSAVLDFDSRVVRTHAMPRHFSCRQCHPRVSLAANVLRDDAQRRWDSGWEAIHVPRGLVEVGATLARLVDADSGLFESRWTSGAADRRAIGSFLQDRGVKANETPFMDAARVVVTRSRIRATRKQRIASEGFDFHDPRLAEALALVEGVERVFACDDTDPSRLVRAAYADVDGMAIDPGEIPLFSDAQYRETGFPFRRFNPSAEMDWLWGIRIASGRPVLVPANLIDGRPPDAILHATSNGAACHSSLHHAVLNGLYEVVERDALMVTWLKHRSLPRLILSDDDPDPYGVRAAFGQMSFQLTHVDLTTDLAIPVVLSALEDRQDPNFFMCTMAASLSPSRLLAKLHRELSQFTFPHLVEPSHYRTALSANADPAGVRTLPDHLRFYQDSSKRMLTAFLTASAEERGFATLAEEGDWSIDQELQDVVTRLTRAGYDPIVVDCTGSIRSRVGAVGREGDRAGVAAAPRRTRWRTAGRPQTCWSTQPVATPVLVTHAAGRRLRAAAAA